MLNTLTRNKAMEFTVNPERRIEIWRRRAPRRLIHKLFWRRDICCIVYLGQTGKYAAAITIKPACSIRGMIGRLHRLGHLRYD